MGDDLIAWLDMVNGQTPKRKRGRPPLPGNEVRGAEVKVRVTDADRRLVEATARAHDTSISEIVCWCIEGYLPTLYTDAIRERCETEISHA